MPRSISSPVSTPESVPSLAHRIAVDQISFPKVVQGLDYWRSICAGRRFPTRADIDPSRIKSLLPNVMLLRALDGGADFEFRIVGGRTIEEHGFSPLNWRVSQLDSVVDGYADFLLGLLSQIRSSAKPIALSGTLSHVDRGFRKYESVYLPLGTGSVDHILNVTDYSARIVP